MSLAVFIPISGWIADRFGARTVFCAAIGVFTLGSVLCGASSSLTDAGGARVLQGIGGAMMVPVGRLVMLQIRAGTDLVRGDVAMSRPALIGPVIGPPLGGLIVTYASWRWIFFLNVPLGLLGFACALKLIPNTRHDRRG